MADTMIGKLVYERGKFFVEAEGMRQALPAGAMADKAALRKLAGRDVKILLTEPKQFVAAVTPADQVADFVLIICYVPPPEILDILRGVITQPNVQVRTTFAKNLRDTKIISEEVAAAIMQR